MEKIFGLTKFIFESFIKLEFALCNLGSNITMANMESQQSSKQLFCNNL